MTREYAFNMLVRVRDEFEAGRLAIKHVLAVWNSDRTVLDAAIRGGITESQLDRCAANLEITFTLRLFSEFKATLRDYWLRGLNRNTEPPMSDLMESIARRLQMNRAHLAAAHQIREYRNDVIHESLRDARFDFPSCRSALARYLSWFPVNW